MRYVFGGFFTLGVDMDWIFNDLIHIHFRSK